MKKRCPNCHREVQELARYCARCGQSISEWSQGKADDGAKVAYFAVPPGFSVCDEERGLYYKWESGWGGRSLLSTEPLALLLFNAGETMQDIGLEITALDARSRPVATIRPTTAALPRGETIRVEVPSYELPDEVHSFMVALRHEQAAGQNR